MIDYTIKRKLRYNDSLTFNESHILYDCVEKLEKIEQIVKDSGNFKGERTAHDKYVKISEIILEQE